MEKTFNCAKCNQFYSGCDGDHYVVTHCGHFFHKFCLDEMFEELTLDHQYKTKTRPCPFPECKKFVNKKGYVVLDGYKALKSNLKFSVIVIGDSGVGKTSLTQKFTNDKFDLKTSATIGTDMFKKTFRTGNDYVQMTIWDTSGQEKFDVVCRQYARLAQGVILAYDTTCRKSLINTEKWLKFYRENAPLAETILVGCRQDLEGKICCRCMKDHCRPPTQWEIENIAENLGGICHFKTSAKDDMNVEAAFKSLAAQILENPVLRREARLACAGESGVIQLDSTSESEPKKSPLLSLSLCFC